VKSAIAWPNGKAYLFEKDTTVPIVNTLVPGVNYTRYDFVSGLQDQRAAADRVKLAEASAGSADVGPVLGLRQGLLLLR
jgi:hypothetical protein